MAQRERAPLQSRQSSQKKKKKKPPCREGSPDAGADRPPTGERKRQNRAKRSRSGRARWVLVFFFFFLFPVVILHVCVGREGVEQTWHVLVLVLMLLCLCVVGCSSEIL